VTAAEVPAGGTHAPVVLDVRDVHTYFYTYDGVVRALDGVSFKLRRGETLGLVGETGCGKSVTAFSITRLVAEPPGRIVSGKILFRGANLLWGVEREATFRPTPGTKRIHVRRRFRRIKANLQRMTAVRGSGIGMVFQEPSQAMNPVFSIANQLGEVLYVHRGVEIVEALLAAREPDGAAAGLLPELVSASSSGDRAAIRNAAHRLAELAHLASLETELSVEASATPLRGDGGASVLMHHLGRARLSRLQRAYLHQERQRLLLQRELRKTYLEELREQKPLRPARRHLRSAQLRNALRRAPFRFWGLRGHVDRPVRNELFWRTVAELERVQIANPRAVASGFPHELSGGMLQRVMIAMALSLDPQVLLADEPTTALDVTIQAQILDLMRSLKEREGTAIVLITHDLAVIAEVTDRVCVMYAGQIVEVAPVRQLFDGPLHPYTRGLLASIPRLDRPDKDLASIPGSVPDLIEPPTGCRFHPRCPHAMPVCGERRPPMTVEGEEHQVACFLFHGPAAQE